MKPQTLKFPLTQSQRSKVLDSWTDIADKLNGLGVTMGRDGTLTGKMEGKISVGAHELELLVTDKPWLLSMDRISKEIQAFIG